MSEYGLDSQSRHSKSCVVNVLKYWNYKLGTEVREVNCSVPHFIRQHVLYHEMVISYDSVFRSFLREYMMDTQHTHTLHYLLWTTDKTRSKGNVWSRGYRWPILVVVCFITTQKSVWSNLIGHTTSRILSCSRVIGTWSPDPRRTEESC